MNVTDVNQDMSGKENLIHVSIVEVSNLLNLKCVQFAQEQFQIMTLKWNTIFVKNVLVTGSRLLINQTVWKKFLIAMFHLKNMKLLTIIMNVQDALTVSTGANKSMNVNPAETLIVFFAQDMENNVFSVDLEWYQKLMDNHAEVNLIIA